MKEETVTQAIDPLMVISNFLQQKSIDKQNLILELNKAEQGKANKEKIKRLKASIGNTP